MPATLLPSLLALFCGSGAAALIYEIVWFQLLELVIGSSTASMGVLLGTFMGGMCLGAIAGPRIAGGQRKPLRAYAYLELFIGMCGLAMLAVMPAVDRAYAAWGGSGASGLILREVVAALCLLPPTVAMGAALPVAARALDGAPRAAAWLGWVYAANIAGSAVGALTAGFYLLRVHDLVIATYVAASVNLLVGAAAFVVASDSKILSDGVSGLEPAASSPKREDRVVLLVIALSGFCALAAEVVWTRLLALLFGATVYTFSIVLAVFLAALGAGSAAGAALGRKTHAPQRLLGACQWLAVIAIAWGGFMLSAVLPYWRDTTAFGNITLTLQLDLARAALAVAPAAFLWGASFPLAMAATRGADASRMAARAYASNTLGAIAGALLVSLLLVARLGTQHTEWVMIGVSWLGGALLIRPPRWRAVAIALSSALALACASAIPPLPPLLVAYGRHAANWSGKAGDIFYVGEGANSSVAVSRTEGGVLNYHNAGKVQASSQPQDMRLQRMLGHLTTLVPSAPRSVLVIGCGAGVTAGAVSLDPAVEAVTIAEIEPLVPKAAGEFFKSANADVIHNPKVHVRIDDARHFLLTTKEKFDAITSDPLDPWVKGAATLYTSEFFDLAKAHLNPGGVMTIFVQLYESSPDTVRSEAATFFGAFPNGTVWGNTYDGRTGDTVLLGQVEPTVIDVTAVNQKLGLPAYADVRRSLGEVGFFAADELFGSYGGRASELTAWLRDAPINTDRNLRLQYLAGLGFNMHAGDAIYPEILKYRTFPDDMFVGDTTAVREAILGPKE
ncbi:MAG TPA: fused MFS/spermidine synthase [Vicinamibacterales bacterium]|nr:fused MFS/spermidine synthase [Vicinamibacterales bacterium]